MTEFAWYSMKIVFHVTRILYYYLNNLLEKIITVRQCIMYQLIYKMVIYSADEKMLRTFLILSKFGFYFYSTSSNVRA